MIEILPFIIFLDITIKLLIGKLISFLIFTIIRLIFLNRIVR